MMDKLINRIKSHEGYRGYPYTDTTGHLTIGYGRNLDARPLSRDEAEHLLRNDLAQIERELRVHLPLYDSLDEVRQGALLEMGYNLGVDGVLGFHRMIAALRSGDFAAAAKEAIDSLWAKQVGQRAHRIAYRIEHGRWEDLR